MDTQEQVVGASIHGAYASAETTAKRLTCLTLLDDAAFALGNELCQVSDAWTELACSNFVANGFECLRRVQLANLQQAIGCAQLLELIGGEAAAFQADLVQTKGAVLAGERWSGCMALRPV